MNIKFTYLKNEKPLSIDISCVTFFFLILTLPLKSLSFKQFQCWSNYDNESWEQALVVWLHEDSYFSF